MGEQPYDKPTEDTSWATDGGATLTEPTSGEKADGFSLNDPVPFDEKNWWRNAVGKILNYLVPGAIRIFDDLPSAIAATSAGDLFRLVEAPERWSTVPLTKTSKGGTGFAIEMIATDGQHLYYTQDDWLVAALNVPNASVDEQWALDISAMGALKCIDCDGQAIAIGAEQTTTEDTLKVVDTDGNVLFTDDTYAEVRSVAVDSRDNLFVYFAVTGAGIYTWDDDTGIVMLFASLTTIMSVAVTSEYIIAVTTDGDGDHNIVRYFRNGTSLSTTASDANSGSVVRASIKSDGRRIFAAIYAANHAVCCYPLIGRAYPLGENSSAWSHQGVLDPGATEEAVLAVDGHYVYVLGATYIWVFDKVTGGVIYRWDHSGGGTPTALAADGQRVWTNVIPGTANPNYLCALPVERQPGLWRRLSAAGTDDTMTPLPLKTLAVPLEGV